MADYNLLLAEIPEGTRKSKPIQQKNKLNTLVWYDLGRNFWDIFPQIFLTFRVWLRPVK